MESIIRRLPWKAIRKGANYTRRAFFTTRRPDVPHVKVHMDLEYVEDLFRMKNMRSGWLLSYNYHGEDANLVRPLNFGGDEREYQLHIRLFDNGDGTCDMHAHTELCPINHPKGHITKDEMSIIEGLAMSEKILESEGIERTAVE